MFMAKSLKGPETAVMGLVVKLHSMGLWTSELALGRVKDTGIKPLRPSLAGPTERAE